MIALIGTLLLAASLAFLPPPATATQDSGQPATSPLALLDVPFLTQSEALCGGAAAAMVMRYWGATRVTAEEFAPLVDRDQGGIETTVLVRAIGERGYQAVPASGTSALARRELDDGRPVIALIEDRPGTYHYVVLVGWHERAVVLHDPARTPYVLMDPAQFERRWKTSANWMLAVAPGQSRRSESAVRVAGQSPGSESQLSASGQAPRPAAFTSCDALVAEGVQFAQRNELSAAERLLADAAYRCPGGMPLRELAGVRLLQRRWPEVRDLAGRAVEVDPADAHSWRLLATARYIGGDHRGALDAWNRAGEPVVDLVSVTGLQRTSQRPVERLIGLDTGTVLTRAAGERARRRLDELPAATLTRLEYVPRASGTAEVRAHVVERPIVPSGAITWSAIGLRAAASRELAASVTSLGRGGERLDATWRFWPHRPAAGVALHVPGRLGLTSLELFSERQPFSDPTLPDAERLETQARLADWLTGALRWEARAGFTRWQQSGSFGTVGGAVRLEKAGARARIGVDGWLGDSRFARSTVTAGWRSSTTRRGFAIDLAGSVDAISAEAPLDLWPAGDTGHARATLLRAHPVIDDGRLRIDRLGRRLAQASVEGQHWWRAFGAAALGAAIFVDTGRTWATFEGAPFTDVDAGAGFRLALPGRTGTLRADFAHGLRDGRNHLSVAWSSGF